MMNDDCVLYIDGMDDALYGFTEAWDSSGQRITRAVYSGEAIIEVLQELGHSADDARDICHEEIECTYVGPKTPIIVWEEPEELH